MNKSKKLCEIYVSAFIFSVSAYLLRVAYTAKIRTKVIGMNSMAFPKVVLYLLAVLCFYLTVSGIFALIKNKSAKERAASSDSDKIPFFSKEVVASVGLIILYAIGWPYIGFILSSFLFVFIESRLLDSEKPWWHSVIVATAYTLLIYFVFSLGFGVTFPEPILNMIGL